MVNAVGKSEKPAKTAPRATPRFEPSIERSSAMQAHVEGPQLLASLQNLVDRLCSPDLTVAEARDLRPRLLDLLEHCPASDSPIHADRRV